MAVVGWTLIGLLTVYEWILICHAILSWVQVINPRWTPRGAFLVIAEGIYTLTDPPLRLLRKLIKPLRIGRVGFDMAFLVLFCLVILCLTAVRMLCF